MVVTPRIVQEAEDLKLRHNFDSAAAAVAHAIVLTNFVSEATVEKGAKLVLQYPDGREERIIKPELGLK